MRTFSLAALLALLIAGAAVAATKNGITPTGAKSVEAGKRPTLKGRVKGAGPVYVHVSSNKKRDADGVIGSEHLIQKARRRKGGRFTAKARYYSYDSYWLNTPGTYYWQAHRISCENGVDDCRLEGPIVKFRVK